MNKPGPKPKQFKEKIIQGIEIGRGENREIVPPDEVYKLAAIGCTNHEIAVFFGVKEDTLSRNFASELEKGREYTKTRLRMRMFQAADNLNPAILIFLAKNLLGMSDQPNNTQANAPLPWNEEDDTVEIGTEHDEEDITNQE